MPNLTDYAGSVLGAIGSFRQEKAFQQSQVDAKEKRRVDKVRSDILEDKAEQSALTTAGFGQRLDSEQQARDSNNELLDDNVTRSGITTDGFQERTDTEQAQRDAVLDGTLDRNRATAAEADVAEGTVDSRVSKSKSQASSAATSAKVARRTSEATINATNAVKRANQAAANLKKEVSENELTAEHIAGNVVVMEAQLNGLDSIATLSETDEIGAAQYLRDMDVNRDGEPDIPDAHTVAKRVVTDPQTGEEYEELVAYDKEGNVAIDNRDGQPAIADMRTLAQGREQIESRKKAEAEAAKTAAAERQKELDRQNRLDVQGAKNSKTSSGAKGGSGSEDGGTVKPIDSARIEKLVDKSTRGIIGGRATNPEYFKFSEDPAEVGYHKSYLDASLQGAVEGYMQANGQSAGQAMHHFRGRIGFIMAMTGGTRADAKRFIKDDRFGTTEDERLIRAIEMSKQKGN